MLVWCGSVALGAALLGSACGEVDGGGDGPGGQAGAGGTEGELTLLDELRMDDVYGADLALGPNGSLFVVGGKTQVAQFQYTTYRDFWLARVDEQLDLEFEVHEVFDEAQAESESYGMSGAFDGATVTTISTRYVDGERTRIRRFDAEGSPLGEELALPEYTSVRALPEGQGLLFAGTELVRYDEGRPFMLARIDRISDTDEGWTRQFQGMDGSISQVLDLAVDPRGHASLGGILGTATDSNAGAQWVARLSPDGSTTFETDFAGDPESRCTNDLVAVSAEGVTLTYESCSGGHLVAYAPDGEELWRQEVERAVEGLLVVPGGYAISSAEGPAEFTPDISRWTAEIAVYDEGHRLRYRAEVPGCFAFRRLLITGSAFVGVAECADGMRLAKYALPEL